MRVDAEPMTFGEVEEHRRVAACRDDSPGWRFGFKPVLGEEMLSAKAAHPILAE